MPLRGQSVTVNSLDNVWNVPLPAQLGKSERKCLSCSMVPSSLLGKLSCSCPIILLECRKHVSFWDKAQGKWACKNELQTPLFFNLGWSFEFSLLFLMLNSWSTIQHKMKRLEMLWTEVIGWRASLYHSVSVAVENLWRAVISFSPAAFSF